MLIWQRKLKYRFGMTGGKKKYVSCRYFNRQKRNIFFKRIKFAVLSITIILLVTYIITDIEKRINPLINDMALSNLNSIVLRECNSVVSDMICGYDVSYNSLIDKSEGADGSIKSLAVDYTKLNVLKSDLTNEIQTRIDQINSVDISIPLMTFFSDRFYSGVGIPISIRVLTDENVKVDFCDEFITEGINQTKHLIKVKITTDIGINVPIRNNGDAIETEIPIAESIITGNVPNTYIDLN